MGWHPGIPASGIPAGILAAAIAPIALGVPAGKTGILGQKPFV
jgi:hypothetical protein